MSWPAARGNEPFSVTVHPYLSPTRKSCAYEFGNTSSQNALVFIGGLGDGPHTVPYIWNVARHLEKLSSLSYSVFEIRLRSSFDGFGASSLQNDVEDISALVKYLRGKEKKKVVLMGHSTGCQDCMEYTNYDKHHNEPVDGFVLQAPVSDRESLEIVFPEWRESLEVAEKMMAEGKPDWCMPKDKVPGIIGAPITAYRFWSLIAKGGDDDYFSSDLDKEKVRQFWGRFKKPVMVLHSEKDEFVPGYINQGTLNRRYCEANPVISKLSEVVPNTGHDIRDDETQNYIAKKVVLFLESLEKPK